MNVRFENKRIQELYERGRHKKYQLQPPVLKKFFMRIQQLEAAESIYDFWKTPSLNFEHMESHSPPYSIRIDRGWRLEFDINWLDEEKTKGVINVIEISKHYGD